MLGILLSIIVAFLKSLWELAGKIFTDESRSSNIDEYSLAWGTRFFSFFALLPLIFFVDIALPSKDIIPELIGTSVINAITTITALKAVKHGNLSLVSPLSSFTIPFLLLTGYIFHSELPNIYGLLGVGAIFVWSYILWFESENKSLLSPIRSIYSNLWARYMLLTSFFWSISAALDKSWIQELGAIGWMFYTNWLVSICLMLLLLVIRKPLSIAFFKNTSHIKKITAISLIGWWWIFLQFLALKYTLVVFVISIKRASGVFSVLLWFFILKEKNIFWKLVAACIMLLGVIAIILWGNI